MNTTRIRWEKKIRFCEYRLMFRWRTGRVDDFSNYPAGYPTWPPGSIVFDGLLFSRHFKFPWVAGLDVPYTQSGQEDTQNG